MLLARDMVCSVGKYAFVDQAVRVGRAIEGACA